MFIGSPIAQIMNAKIDNLIFLRPLHHALAQRRATDFGEQREDVDLHVCISETVEAAVLSGNSVDPSPRRRPLQKNYSTISSVAR
jgi:hypothetical protein